MGEKNRDNQENEEGKKNALEWSTFAASLLLILCTVAYLGYKTYTDKPSPPEIIVAFSLNPGIHSPYRYRLIVENVGGATAEDVIIEMALKKRDSTLERSELQLAFVPQSSKREGWVNFLQDPAKADTTIAKVVSFKKP